jgi:TolB-like protein
MRLVLAADPADSPRQPDMARNSGAVTAIAVLPFTAHGETATSIQLTADTLTQDLIETLSHVPSLRVIPRNTSQRYQGQPRDIAAVGNELGVRYVLEGSIRSRGDHLRVNVELIDPVTRTPVWSARIDRGVAERAGVEDEIVGRLARALRFDVGAVRSRGDTKDDGVVKNGLRGTVAK